MQINRVISPVFLFGTIVEYPDYGVKKIMEIP